MSLSRWTLICALLLACSSNSDVDGVDLVTEVLEEVADSSTPGDMTQETSDTPLMDTTPDVAPPVTDIAQMKFGKFSLWTNPIEDYIAINTEELGHEDFTKDIFDLTTFGGRLYFGYGDATLNLGRITPIEIRYFSDPSNKEYAFDFTSDEEQIDRYRQFGDLLIIPGLDATEDGLLGNVYTTQEEGEWYKSRTLENAWHVHDAVILGDSLYACGSGGSLDDYADSTVHAYVWKSTDGGENFEVVADREHPNPPGDQRHVYLMPNGSELYVFGYHTDGTGTTYGTSYVLEEDGVAPFAELGSFFVLDTVILDDAVALVVGIHIEDPLRQGAMLMENGIVTEYPGLHDYTVLDAEPLGDGRGLVLYLEGNEYPLLDTGGWPTHVGVLHPDGALVEVADFLPSVRPTAIAYWQGRLYIGMADGSIWRATVVQE